MSLKITNNNFSLNKADFNIERNNGKWTDLYLIGKDNYTVKCHRMIFAASSLFLEQILKEREEERPDEEDTTVILAETPGWVIELLVQMVYGEISIDVWSPGMELLMTTATDLGFIKPITSRNSTTEIPNSAEELLASFSSQDLMNEVGKLTSSSTGTHLGYSEFPSDILDYFSSLEEESLIETTTINNLSTTESFDIASSVNNNKHFQHTPVIVRVCSLEDKANVNNQSDQQNLRADIDDKERHKRQSVDYSCRICQNIFESSNELVSHFDEYHMGEKPWQCDVCSFYTDDIGKMKRHIQCHKKVNKETCEICHKEFRNKVSLRTHRNMVHKMGKQYTCSFCGKVLYSSQYLKKHEATHTGEKFKAVNCKHCGKLIEYTKLKNHELIHTGEKPFKCSECNYRCIQRSNLRIHMKGVHKIDLPRLEVGQKRYSGVFMDGTAGNNDPFDLRSVFHTKNDNTLRLKSI